MYHAVVIVTVHYCRMMLFHFAIIDAAMRQHVSPKVAPYAFTSWHNATVRLPC